MSGGATLADRAGAFIAGAPDRPVAPEAADMARRCLVDWMGVALGAAATEPVAGIVAGGAMAWSAAGTARILRGGRTAPALAALTNATMGHAMDFDDTRGHAPSHLGSPTWAAALAVAEARGRDGAAALTAFVTGYEIAAVLGDVMAPGPDGDQGFGNRMQAAGFHPTAIFGRISAAAAAAMLLGCTAEQATHALAAAATMGGGLTASFGSMAKPLHSGKAAMDGVQAAELALGGFLAARDVFEAPGGLAAAFVQTARIDLDAVAFTAGESLADNSFKPYACGKLIHGHIDAARALRAEWAGRPVRAIRCKVPVISTRLVGRPLPTTPLEAKFSVAFCVAAALAGYPLLPRDFSTERLADPLVRDLMGKVALAVDDRVGRYGSVLDIELADGRILSATVERSRGNPETPLTWDDLGEKFEGLVEPVLGADTGALYAALRGIDAPGGLARVLALVAPDQGTGPG